ncbi:MAG: hypothetical protein IJF40_02285 [Clostridia bacterium]|nr:hypothetical protein [Clostridia bacterium]
MSFSLFIIVTVSIILFLCLAVVIYFQIYKKNINKALSENGNKPKHMIAPYKLVFVLIVFLLSFSITVTSVSGLLYSKEYFQFEKDTIENMENRIVYVDYSFKDNDIRALNSSDIDRIKQILSEKYSDKNIGVIPVYSSCSGITLNNQHVNLFAIDEENCAFLGLSEMQDNTAYFLNEKTDEAELGISVTQIVDNGFVSDRLEYLTLKAKDGVLDKSLVSVIQKENMTPSMLEEPICFVNMNTFYDITSILLDTEISGVADLDNYNELVALEGVYICVDGLSRVSSVSSALTQQNYKAYAPVDAFEDFEKTISTIFTVFILSSVGLVCLSAVNIYLILKAVNKIRDKEY